MLRGEVTIMTQDNRALDPHVFHLLQLKYAMKLEMKGLRHSQGSVYAFVKRTYGLRGNRESVYRKFCEMHKLEVA